LWGLRFQGQFTKCPLGRLPNYQGKWTGDMITEKSAEQLAKEDLVRQALDLATKTVADLRGNPLYMKAWGKALKKLRELKPDAVFNRSLSQER
jgi:hypothetical protein